MREPRRGLTWSRGRLGRRVTYSTWMASAAWRRTRAAWRARWVAEHGAEPVCAVCSARWTLRRGDLHHRSYDRLGHEAFEDLSPLCRPCHEQVHLILESSPAWRRMHRAQATDLIVAHLHRRRIQT